jgi:hypothetical protein
MHKSVEVVAKANHQRGDMRLRIQARPSNVTQKEMEILVIETRARPIAFNRCEGRDLPLIDIPF